MPSKHHIIVLGGNNSIGLALADYCRRDGRIATFLSRRPMSLPANMQLLTIDLNDGDQIWQCPSDATVVSFLPLPTLVGFLPRLEQAKAIIAVGSTSRFSKAASSDQGERALAATLQKAERDLQDWAASHAVTWTLLRPTLIYDGVDDKNITRMAAFIRRWRFLPIAAPACGLRQPIHSGDVAQAAFRCIDNPDVACRAFNIAGGEVLTYRQMAERVFMTLALKPRFLPLPARLLGSVFQCLRRIGWLRYMGFGSAVFQRMNENLIFEHADGLRLIGYRPRPFQLHPQSGE